jgi:hypothetical protein
MKRITLILVLLLMASPALADTAVVPTLSFNGGFAIVTLTVTGDVAGGAVADEAVDLSFITRGGAGLVPWYLYYVETIPGAAALAPDAYTVVLKDADGGTVLSLSARSTSAKEYANAAEDLPNYWPVTGNLTLDVSDIGASNATVIKLIFTK